MLILGNIGFVFKRIKFRIRNLTSSASMSVNNSIEDNLQIITEGKASVKTMGKVFYNPVQEFNRDLSISVLTTFTQHCKTGKEKTVNSEDITTVIDEDRKPGVKCINGITILEALSATGLRSIRYAKEIPGIKQIIANDLSQEAVKSIQQNIIGNNVEELIAASHNDATMLMYQHRRENQFDVIDLDPYGCPSIFLDSAVQSIKNGGLMLVTATDMAVLAGNSPETCYSKYGSISLRMKSCHEMALRILLQCIECHANRYGKYIEPLLSISIDFYIRVFVRVFEGANKCKYTLSKLSTVHHCTGCGSFVLRPLGVLRKNEKNNQDKFCLPTGSEIGQKCEHCGHSYHIGGPIWSAPIHNKDFVRKVFQCASDQLTTYRRIEGVLSVILEELDDVPLYYTLDKISETLHVQVPPMLAMRSAILNAGYRVSYTHGNRVSIKTDAPGRVLWDIMRCWTKKHPVSSKRLLDGTPVKNILAIQPEKEYSFDLHSDANPESKRKGLVRYQANPTAFWGPGTRATAMVGEDKMAKSKRKQNKRKREQSEENECGN